MTAPQARVTPAWFFRGQSAVRSVIGPEFLEQSRDMVSTLPAGFLGGTSTMSKNEPEIRRKKARRYVAWCNAANGMTGGWTPFAHG